MTHQHAVVWIDHREATIIQFGLSGHTRHTVHSDAHQTHLHHKANTIGDGKAPPDPAFYEKVASGLSGITALLLAGPGVAKVHFADHLRAKHPSLGKAIKGTETLDHPTEGELLTFAKSFMRAADRMQP